METTEITIAVIKPNSFKFTKSEYYNNIDKLTADVSPFIEIKHIAFAEMMDNIVTHIGLTPETMGDSIVCYETATNIFQLCLMTQNNNFNVQTDNDNDNENNENNNNNNIGRFLIGEKVNGTCVMINSKINQTNTCLPDNVILTDIVKIIYSKFVHKGLFISHDSINPLIEFDYFDHPIEYYNIINQDDFDKYKLMDLNLFDFHLCLIINKEATENINKRATLLFGEQLIYGDVIIISKSTHEYFDLTEDICIKLMNLSHGSLKNRELVDTEIADEKKIDGLPMAINKYFILENRMQKYKNICSYCHEELNDKQLTCTGCYRNKYHSEECQHKDWNSHKTECLYKQKK